MKQIKLQCATAGYKYGDVVEVSKGTIDTKSAKSLVTEGLAIEVKEVVVVQAPDIEAILVEAQTQADKIIADANEKADVIIADAEAIKVKKGKK